MTHENHSAHAHRHGDYERRDIGVSGVIYFMVGLAVAGVLVYFVVDGLYHALDKFTESRQTPISPLVANAPKDTRAISSDYPKTAFPEPRLEEDERGQLNGIRLKEEETLSTYDYIDKNAGTVRIPIDRAMDLIAEHGLPVRQGTSDAAASKAQSQTKGSQP